MSKKKRKSNKFISAIMLAVAIALIIIYLFPNTIDYIKDLIEEPRKPTVTDGELSVHYLDVGQGDSILILAPSGESMLIDTSLSDMDETITEYIKSLGIKKLDYLLLTHPDADHIGSASKILKSIGAKKVIMSDVTHTTKTFETLLLTIDEMNIPLVIPKTNDRFELGNAVFTVLGPVKKSSDLNDMSLVIRLDYGEKSFMFTGDCGIKAEEEMLDEHTKGAFKADVIKLGHHGSSTSSSKEFLDAVDPDIAIISCGKGNSYGHPHKEIIEDLNKRDVTYYRTDKQGNIILSTDGKKIEVLKPAS